MTQQTDTHHPQLTLPGQAAAAPGPLDMRGMYLAHHGFRRDLRSFADAVARTPLEDRATWQALARHWTLFGEILHHHHAAEDAGMWPLLVGRVTPEQVGVLEAMEAEHAVIDPLLETCAAGLRSLASRPNGDLRAALTVRMVAARERLGEHLRHEEVAAIPLLQHLITPEEWDQIQREHTRGKVQVRRLPTLVAWMLHDVPTEMLDRLWRQPGSAGMRVVWVLGRRGFARRRAAAFRYAG